MTEKTKIETAIDLIAKQGSARTPEIAQALGIVEKNVRPLLDPAIRAGYLITCQVEKHTPDGIRRMSEFRLSSTVSESKVSWKLFKIKSASSAPSTAPTKAEPAPVKPAVEPTVEAPGAVKAQAEPFEQKLTVQTGKSLFLLGSDGCLRIEAGGITFELTRDETHNLGLFLDGSSGFWRYSRSEPHAHA